MAIGKENGLQKEVRRGIVCLGEVREMYYKGGRGKGRGKGGKV